MVVNKRLNQWMGNAAHDWMDFAFPRVCVCCGDLLLRSEMEVCWVCYAQLPFSVHSFGHQNPVAKSLWGRVPIWGGYYLLNYQSQTMTSHILKSLKYDGGVIMAKRFGILMGEELHKQGFHLHCEGLIPVPMHPKKELKRGYNPAKLIAQGISESLGIDLIENALIKRNATVSQTKKNRIERWYQTQHHFDVTTAAQGLKQVALVDDVFTTGATAERCLRSLYSVGVERAAVLSLAFTV
jgi:ComF family protein